MSLLHMEYGSQSYQNPSGEQAAYIANFQAYYELFQFVLQIHNGNQQSMVDLNMQ